MLVPRQPQTTLAPSGIPTSQSSLVFNSTATNDPNQRPPPLTGSGPLTTHTSTEPSSSSPNTLSPVSSAEPSASSVAAAASNIPTGAVVGAVLGSLAFLSIVISFILWHSRRYNPKPNGGDIHKTRNWERRKSKQETWSPLQDQGETDMKSNSYLTAGYPPLPSTYLREKQQHSETPQLPLPPVSPLPFSTKFDLTKSPSPSPLPPDPVPHPYTNRALGLHPPTSPGFQPLAKQTQQPQPQLQPEYHSFTHPYATASPLHHHFSTSPQAGSSLLPDADDQSFYSMDSPALSGSLATQQQTVASTSRDTTMPEQTGNRSHNHNPFFTAHPSSHDGPEKWGSVGKARTVAPVELHMHKPSNSSSAMENLIAALSLGPSPAPSIHNNPLNRSHHGHLGSSLHHTAPSQSPSPSENENPFEFDEVYGQDIAFSASEPSPRSKGRESAGNLSTGTSTSLDGPSPGLFPMPPR